MDRLLARLSLILSFVFLYGCSSTPQLKMDAQRAPLDESVLAPNLLAMKIKRLMVAPPIGAPLRLYDPIIANLEREFLKNGVTIVSSIALDQGPVDKEHVQALAKRMDVDAVLQIGDWEWSRDLQPKRFFIFDGTGDDSPFHEVTVTEYRSFNGYKVAFPASELRFTAKLIHPSNGEVLGTFDLRSATNFQLPARYIASVVTKGDRPVITNESFAYASPGWVDEARRQAEGSLIRAIAERILSASSGERRAASNDPKPLQPVPVTDPSTASTSAPAGPLQPAK